MLAQADSPGRAVRPCPGAALLCRLHLHRIAVFDEAAGGQDERIAGSAARRLGEIGPAPHLHFATHGKLASWVTLCPGNNISARKRKHGRTGDAGT